MSKGFIEGSTSPSLIVGELGYPRVRVYLGINPLELEEESVFL